MSRHVRYLELELLNHIAHIEVSSLDVLHAVVVLTSHPEVEFLVSQEASA